MTESKDMEKLHKERLISQARGVWLMPLKNGWSSSAYINGEYITIERITEKMVFFSEGAFLSSRKRLLKNDFCKKYGFNGIIY